MTERRKLTVGNLTLGFRRAGNPLHACLVLLNARVELRRLFGREPAITGPQEIVESHSLYS